MSLTSIQNRILQPFIEETLVNLNAMAGMQGRTDPGFTDRVDQFRFKGYAICAETQGGIDGVMLMHHYIETAVAMGNAIRSHVLGDGKVLNEINEPMADALAEWGNTVIGRATKALGEANLNIQFEPPYFVFDTDTMKSLLVGVTDIITVPVHVDGVGRFYFNYLIRSIRADMGNMDETAPEPGQVDTPRVAAQKGSTRSLPFDHKIMIVDDMKMIRTSLKIYLKELGYQNVVEAANGREAVEKCAIEQPDFVFMDVVMPEINGNEALKLIRAEARNMPVVMLTSVADKDIIKECEGLGIDGYIIKPLTKETGPQVLSKFLCP